MATLKPLLALKSSALKSLAASLGVSSTGTKSQLASQIVSACCETVPFFERPMLERQPSCEGVTEAGLDTTALGTEGRIGKGGRERKKDKRVLSIDMGIRNLAMCVLEVPDSGLRKTGSKRKVAKSLPKLLAWERVVVAKKPVAEVEESMSASPGKLISGSKRSLKKVKVTESSPPEGELKQEAGSERKTPKSKSRSKKRVAEATEAENPSEKEQLVEKEKSFEKGNETKEVAEELEGENMLKEETAKVPRQEKKPLDKKGNEPTEVAEELLEDEQRTLDVPAEQATPKSKSTSRKVKVLAKEIGVAGEPFKKDQGVLVRSEEATPEGTEGTQGTEALSPSGEQGALDLKKIDFEEVIPDGKSRSRKGGKVLPPEELKAPKQEELHETRLGSKSRSRKGKKVAEAQSPEKLVSPISTPNTDLNETPKKGGRVKRKPKKKAESFEPSVYALLANTFVRHLLNRFSPLDAVLIERQRYRSNSAPAIQEWTVRVNMFEAMLHAVFCCLHGKESPVAESVSPNRVTKFWLDRMGGRFLDIQKPKGRKKKEVLGEGPGEELGAEGANVVIKKGRTYGKAKLAKVSLVKEWLRSGDVVSLGKDVRGIAADFGPVKGRRKANSVSGGKLDDLADCLLQGIAWIRWEENRKSLAEGKLIPEFVPCANSKS